MGIPTDSQESVYRYKDPSLHLIGLYLSATLVIITTSTLVAGRLQILHVLEPALQLAQFSYRLQTLCCWISLSILI